MNLDRDAVIAANDELKGVPKNISKRIDRYISTVQRGMNMRFVNKDITDISPKKCSITGRVKSVAAAVIEKEETVFKASLTRNGLPFAAWKSHLVQGAPTKIIPAVALTESIKPAS